MVWGGVKERGRSLLVVDAGYLIGRRYDIPFIQAQANKVAFQQDNAIPHIARVVRDYLIRCVTVASVFIRFFTHWARLGWNGMTVTSSAKSASDALIRIWNNIPMEMVNTHATDFGNVQRTPCVVQNIYPMNSSDLKCYLSNYVMKNLTIYCIQ